MKPGAFLAVADEHAEQAQRELLRLTKAETKLGGELTGTHNIRGTLLTQLDLASMLDDANEFNPVPRNPVIEQRLGRQLAATVRGGGCLGKLGGSTDQQWAKRTGFSAAA